MLMDDDRRVTAAPDGQSAGVSWDQVLLLASLVLINIVNLMDRSLLGILGEPIKNEFGITDTELGFVSGAAFFVVYTLFSLPMARIADRGSRKAVVLVSLCAWCSLTTVVGLATSYWQLVVMRAGVAVGEAGVLPATQALVYEQISPRRRGLAMGLLVLGGAIGAVLAPLVGGWASDFAGWRGAFLMIGPFGLLLVPVLMYTIKSGAGASVATPVAERPAAEPRIGTFAAIGLLAGSPAYRTLWLAAALLFVGPSAYLSYAGPFFIRTFAVSPGVAGGYMALCGIGSMCGVLAGGFLFDRLGRTSPGGGLMVPALGACAASLIAIAGWYGSSITIAAVCFGGAWFFGSWVNAPNFAASQALSPPGIRSTSAAVFNFGSVVGGVAGSLIVGVVSDHLAASYGSRSLIPGLALASTIQLAGALLMIRAAFLIGADRAVPGAPAPEALGMA